MRGPLLVWRETCISVVKMHAVRRGRGAGVKENRAGVWMGAHSA